jgi:PAS domain S-box-containing protein
MTSKLSTRSRPSAEKILLLNASRFESTECAPSLILLAIEDITERRRAEVALEDSELRYRRLFETAQDAILILDERQGKIFDANPFIKNMLGYSQVEIVGKELWQIGMFRDAEETKPLSANCKTRAISATIICHSKPRRGSRSKLNCQQRLSGRSSQGHSVQHSGHHRTQPPGTESSRSGGSVSRTSPAQGRVPGDAFP